MLRSTTVERETPDELFQTLNSFYHFTLDPCASHINAKCDKYYTKETDGLSKSWKGEVVFMNPPYGKDIEIWMKKAYDETRDSNALVVALIPASTSAGWFHDYVLPGARKIFFIKHRLQFKGTPTGAPFSSLIIEFGDTFGESPVIAAMDRRGMIIW